MNATVLPRALFIGGLGRSGSTLLELILTQSPDVCALGEVVHLWQRALRDDELCGCGSRFSGCTFWQQVGERAFGGWSKIDVDEVLTLKAEVDRTRYVPRLARARLRQPWADQVHRYAAYYTRIYQAAKEVSDAAVVVDSSKHASLAFVLRWADNLDLRMVHLVRDSRGVAYSWTKQVPRPEAGEGEYMPRFSALRVAGLWTAQNTAFDLLASRMPVTRLRYEDFTADPRGWTRRIRALAGLPDTDEALRVLDDPTHSPARAHTVAGNPLRFSDGPVRVRRDDAWRTALPPARRMVVGAATLPLRIRYGYRGQHRSTLAVT